MSEIATVRLDLAKNVFQAYGTDASGRAVLRKKLRRDQVLDFSGGLAPCVVAMEACGGARFRGREIGKLRPEVRLIPPAYVKPIVKRQRTTRRRSAKRPCAIVQLQSARVLSVFQEGLMVIANGSSTLAARPLRGTILLTKYLNKIILVAH